MHTIAVNIFSEREEFTRSWRRALAPAHPHADVYSPRDLHACAATNAIVIIDASWEQFTQHTLVRDACYARARGATCVVALPPHHRFPSVFALLDEVCLGLVCVGPEAMARVAQRLIRSSDELYTQRFELLQCAPNGTDLLAVVGNGSCTLLKRPLDARDDASPIASIFLNNDGGVATVALESGLQISLKARALSRSSPVTQPELDLHGLNVGARLRAFRLQAQLTQAEVSRRTGIHRPNIARVEAGKHLPSLETLTRLANAIGIAPMRLLEHQTSSHANIE